ncbi:biotin synthase BioB [Megasphaera vaginalis (ex Bordigoni et al. 2020)]|uniref:biotin synthase BioB n=1 Tax=Megasphaera vaginalis (ex Bordigoni et al. 2020) TaxID=2045301 RepID=UPI000C7B1C88|nr:biotin synthase BioB [Megasphaera vaginalis (ex Bordigoni et al. 2020)]
MELQKLITYTERVNGGGELTKEEALELLSLPDNDTPLLLAFADKIRQHFHGDAVDCCAIVNGRSGKCPENCRFCAQSAHYDTGVSEYPLLSETALLQAAAKAKAAGATRFSIVTGGRSVTEGPEFTAVLTALRRIRSEVGIETCCSLGLITNKQLHELKAAGVGRYHANIETAPSYFPSICSTHGFADKAALIRMAGEAGLRVCSGGIIGLGETPEQRIEMACTLRDLGVDSIPLNILNPIAGTPLAAAPHLEPWEILRTFAVFRFLLPQAQIRTAGGREANLRSLQAYALTSGLNGLMIGGYLTTSGNAVSVDAQMLADLKRKPVQPQC